MIEKYNDLTSSAWYSPLVNTAAQIREHVSEAFLNPKEPSNFFERQFERLLRHWGQRGDANSQQILRQVLDRCPIQSVLATNPHHDRWDPNFRLSVNHDHVLRWIHTSGSTGVPLRYPISSAWRAAHHAVWEIAYHVMSSGNLRRYLDPVALWAMARPPGGRLDRLSHLIECVPTANGVEYSSPPNSAAPDVVHGSVTTMLEMLEDTKVQRWTPKFVVLTYEGFYESQLQLLRSAWPSARFHIEYAANDGGASAFTCPYGTLHFCTARAIPLLQDGLLQVCDLWNDAGCFVSYRCGDEVKWPRTRCACGSRFPAVKILGRRPDVVRLRDGRVLPAICPLTSKRMVGIKALKLVVQTEDTICIRFVRNPAAEIDESGIIEELVSWGFSTVKFAPSSSIKQLRSNIGKFRTVVDERYSGQAEY